MAGKGLVASLYNRLKEYPFGKSIFSFTFCSYAPYFFSISPYVKDLRPGYAAVTMKQWWYVQNHIGTVHAIAICNLVEMCMGLVVEMTVPSHLRWLPMGMNIDYIKKASGKLEASSTIDPATFFTLAKYPDEVRVPVEVQNAEGVILVKAEVRIWLSEKPSESTKKPKNSSRLGYWFTVVGLVAVLAAIAFVLNNNSIAK